MKLFGLEIIRARPKATLIIKPGSRGRLRWTLRHEGEARAISPVYGFNTIEETLTDADFVSTLVIDTVEIRSDG